MRKKYETPTFEVTKFQLTDVIAASAAIEDEYIGAPGNEDDWWSDEFL